jgi:hypothetical protein
MMMQKGLKLWLSYNGENCKIFEEAEYKTMPLAAKKNNIQIPT